ncbi:MAG: hypothetical protein IT385_21230 [Deltaproteobacteria bacterium]|nr:hypothetical protein [Deltaproteobacteria bacterium]
MDPISPYTAADRQRWKQLLLAKGREVSSKLEDILAGKDATLDDFDLKMDGEPAETKEKRLRRYFDHLMQRLRVIDHPRFGWDADKRAFLPIAVLDDAPWTESEPSERPRR